MVQHPVKTDSRAIMYANVLSWVVVNNCTDMLNKSSHTPEYGLTECIFSTQGLLIGKIIRYIIDTDSDMFLILRSLYFNL